MMLLPFKTDAPLRTFHYSAFASGIVSAFQEIGGAILNHHIQIYFPHRKLLAQERNAHVQFLPGMGLEQFANMGYLRITPRDTAWLSSLDPESLVEEVIGALSRNIYIHAYGDDFFVPDTYSFARRHFRHSSLLIGFDRSKRVFIGACYRKNGMFQTLPISFEAFAESLKLAKYGVAKPGCEVVVEEIERLAKADDQTDPELILRQISDYLRGDNSVAAYQDGGSFSVPIGRCIEISDSQGACGLGVYECYQRYIQNRISESMRIDLRATRLLLEHKTMMHLALQCVPSVPPSVSRTYNAEVIPLAYRIHLAAIAFNQKREPGKAKVLFSDVKVLAQREFDILSLIHKSKG